jgi:hypothetical protein
MIVPNVVAICYDLEEILSLTPHAESVRRQYEYEHECESRSVREELAAMAIADTEAPSNATYEFSIEGDAVCVTVGWFIRERGE